MMVQRQSRIAGTMLRVASIILIVALLAVGLKAADESAHQVTVLPGNNVGSDIKLPSSVDMGSTVQSTFSGLAIPAQRVTVSAPLGGVLMNLHVHEGQTVDADQLLAEMDHRAAEAAVEVARLRANDDASVRHARYALEHASLHLQSVRKAHGAGAGSDFELRQAVLRQKQAKSAYEVKVNRKAIAVAALKFEEEKFARNLIKSPFSGRVVQVFAQPGAMLRASEPLLKVITLRTLEVKIHMPVSYFGKLEVGQAYPLIAQEPVGRTLTGTLKSIDPVIDSVRGAFRCVFTVPNEDESLPAGFAVQFDIESIDQLSVATSTDPERIPPN